MIELRGKYNTAKVFTDIIDSSTIGQITALLNQEFVQDAQIRIMPDCHAGAGCVVGTTITLKDKVVLNILDAVVSMILSLFSVRPSRDTFRVAS